MFKSDGKILLTPCRRIGLSRIRKTPSSLTKTTPTQPSITDTALNSNPNPLKIETPIEKNQEKQTDKSSNKKENSIDINDTTPVSTNEQDIVKTDKKKKKNISKCLIKEDVNKKVNTSPKPFSIKSELNDNKNVSVKRKTLTDSKSNCDSPPSKKSNFKGFTDLEQTESKKYVENLEIDTIKDSETTVKLNIDKENVIKDTKTEKIPVQPKKFKRSLSMKKSSEEIKKNNSIEKVPNDNKIKECSIKLHKLDIPLEISENEQLSTISIESIQKLEEENAKKRKILDDLTQAEIFQNLHNLEEIQNTTNKWKTGCISALSDLLIQLKEKMPNFDMSMLLNELKIPENMITLLPTGDLG